jgi:hypothetical protein
VTYFDEALGYPTDLTDLGRRSSNTNMPWIVRSRPGGQLKDRGFVPLVGAAPSRPCIDVSNGARISLLQSRLEVFSRRALRRLRRTLLPGSEAWWSLRAGPTAAMPHFVAAP